MIEHEFLPWIIFGTSLISYSIGYFLWLFVHWYYDERPKKKQGERIVKAINDYNERHKEELDKRWEENMEKIKENNKGMAEMLLKAQKKLTEDIERQILSPPAKTSGEPKLWKILSPKGQYVCHVSAIDVTKALDRYAITDHVMRDQSVLD